MKKKIFLAFILINLIISCGKKGDPEYKESINKITIQSTVIKTS
tara:strand:- start:15 stop:146 length:132 start_codon:yes stop_codon:yes gene_type:complete